MKLLVATAALLVLTACGSDADTPGRAIASPEEAVTALIRAVDAGSCDDVKAVAVTPDAIDCEQIETLRGSYTDDGVDLDAMTASAGAPAGSSVTVTIDLGTDTDETWQAEKVAGSWRVLFDSEV